MSRKRNMKIKISTHLNYLSQNVTFSHLLFGRVSSGRETISLIRSTHYSLLTTHYSPLTIHLFITIWSFHFSLITQSYFLFHTRHMNIITNIVIFCHRIIYIFLEYFFSTTDLQILQYRIIEFIR